MVKPWGEVVLGEEGWLIVIADPALFLEVSPKAWGSCLLKKKN